MDTQYTYIFVNEDGTTEWSNTLPNDEDLESSENNGFPTLLRIEQVDFAARGLNQAPNVNICEGIVTSETTLGDDTDDDGETIPEDEREETTTYKIEWKEVKRNDR